jgi:hypothetical protein
MPASTVLEAARSGFPYERDVWADTSAQFNTTIVPRYELQGGVPVKVLDEVKENLLYREVFKPVLVTGQRGSGKSTELRRLAEEPEVYQKLEVIRFLVRRWLSEERPLTARDYLFSLAAALAEHIERKEYHTASNLGFALTEDQEVAAWLNLLKGTFKLDLSRLASGGFKLKTAFLEASPMLRSDDELRARLLKEDHFEVSRLMKLVRLLLQTIHQCAQRKVCLLVDDTDKFVQEATQDNLFRTHLHDVLGLPCLTVLTFPYNLHFDESFMGIASQRYEVVVINNVKVVKRDQPMQVLPEAREFFGPLFDIYAERSLITGEALDEAIRLSAGIPREFLRVLEKGFSVARRSRASQLDEVIFNIASHELENSLLAATQLAETRKRLKAIRLSRLLHTREDHKLLDSLFVVEMVNHRPWYDVHPLMQVYVDGLIDEDRDRLQRSGVTPELLDDKLRELLLGAPHA